MTILRRPLYFLFFLEQGAPLDGSVFVEGQEAAGRSRQGSTARPPKLTLVSDDSVSYAFFFLRVCTRSSFSVLVYTCPPAYFFTHGYVQRW